MQNETDISASELASFARRFVIRDGRSVLLRAIRPDDKHWLQEGFRHLTRESISFRFLGPRRELTEAELKFYTEIDFEHHVGLLASMNIDGEDLPIAVGRYIEKPGKPAPRTAEIAFTVADEFQNMGIGTLLFEQIVVLAQQKGIKRLVADVRLENKNMLEVIAHSGFELEKQSRYGITHIEFEIAGRTFNKYYI